MVPHESSVPLLSRPCTMAADIWANRSPIAVAPSVAKCLHRCWPAHRRRGPLVLADTQRLVHASREADALRQIFPCAGPNRRWGQRRDASCQLGLSADSIHLACHGVFRSDNPAFFRPRTGRWQLSALDARSSGLSNALAVLSACDSGVATESEGDEVFGLVRAFLIGGASRVVASLWPVDDETTVDWMTAFTGHFNPARRRLAPASWRSELFGNGMRNPFHWAPFATFGGW